MKRPAFVQRLMLVMLACLALSLTAQAATPRILLVGDSWAFFMYANRSLQTALIEEGLGDYEEVGIYTSIAGSTAQDWVNPDWLKNIDLALRMYPTVDIIHLSLGGNDFLNEWSPRMSKEKEEALFQRVVRDLEVVVRYCLNLKPTLKVAIINYEIIDKTKGGGTVKELNQAGAALARLKMELSKRIDRCEYVQNYGVLQHAFGYPPYFGPGEAPYPGQAPSFEPFPGGNLDYGSPPGTMSDKIHMNKKGYDELARHFVKVLYKKWLTEGAPLATK